MLFTADGTGELLGFFPVWEGEESMLLHLPSMMFDEYVAYVPEHRVPGAVGSFEELVMNARANWQTAGPLVLFVDLDMELLKEQPTSPAGSLRSTVRMDYGNQRVWTRTEFTPKSARALLLTFGYQLAWNWVFSMLYPVEAGADEEIDAVLDNMAHQIEYYRQVGVANDFFLRNIGRAPFYAMAKGSGSRYVEELAAMAGMTADEFRSLPEPDQARLIEQDTIRALERMDETESNG
jgi:hypothetical protein